MWFIVTSNSRTNTTINTSYYYFVKPHTEPTSDTFHPLSQITTFVPCNHADSPPHLLGRYCNPNPTRPCALPARDGNAAAHPTPYPRRLLENASVHIVSFSDMIYKPPRSTARTACAILQPLTSWTLSVPMVGPGGRGGRRRGGGGVYQT